MMIQDNKTHKCFCEGCILGKPQRNTYLAIQENERDTIPGTFFHIDLCGPMSTKSLGGASYFMLCKDNNTGYMFIFFFENKIRSSHILEATLLINATRDTCWYAKNQNKPRR